jgi:hypothetical protein
MPRFRTKVAEVEAIQLKNSVTISGGSHDTLGNPLSAPQSVSAGDWLVTYPDGDQEYVADTDFAQKYEEVAVVRRGRPPKGHAAAVAAPKRRRRHRARARKLNGKAAKAA